MIPFSPRLRIKDMYPPVRDLEQPGCPLTRPIWSRCWPPPWRLPTRDRGSLSATGVPQGDEACLAELQGMVRDYFAAGSLLDRPAVTVATRSLHDELTRAKQIGPYKLRELLGEGGMGMVYVAEQEKPIRRKVALKVIKPGMDSRQVIARFEAERQALSLMDHPNIARVLDAGTTDSGRPYFVMELVKGLPITEHCDKYQLDTRKRLELFQQICRAVQHVIRRE